MCRNCWHGKRPFLGPCRHLTCQWSSLDHLGLRFRLAHHLTHGHGRSRGPLLSPGFQPLAGLFDVLEQVGILKSGAPGRNDGAHAVPHDPDFSIALKKKFIVDQAAIHDARHHFPITDHHADVENTYIRMVISYWEMVASIVRM